MNKRLIDIAYELAKQHYTAAELTVFQELDAKFPDEDFDTIHHAGKLAMQLHLTSLKLVHRVREERFPYDKAIKILQSQFCECPAATCQRAFEAAYVKTR